MKVKFWIRRVLVMQDGAVVEFEAPDVLLQDPLSLFSRLYNQR
jgi:ABC-type multidrug transport system fused ATPase/permease subunit